METTTELKPEEILANKVEEMKSELVKKGLAEESIEKLKAEYSGLVIADLGDTLQYNRVHDSLQVVKKHRIAIEKFCKANRDVFNGFVKSISAEEKRLLSLLQPLEDHLFNERKKVDDEKERLAKIEKEANDKKMNDRIKALGAVGVVVDFADVTAMDDATYDNLLEESTLKFNNAENERKEKEAEQKKEAERLEAQRIAQEEEGKKQEATRLENERQQKVLAEQQEKLREDKFKVRLQQLKGASFDGEGIYFDGQKLATKEELINIEDDKFYSLLKSHEEAVLRIAEEAEKKRLADLEAAKEAERLKAQEEEKEKQRTKREELIQSRVDQLQKYAPELDGISNESRENIGDMTEQAFVEEVSLAKAEFEKKKEAERIEAEKHAEAMKSDLEKLENLALHLEQMSSEFPTLESEEANKILSETKEGLGKIAFLIRERSKTV